VSDNITLPREVVKLALDHIEWYIEKERGGRFAEVREAAEALRTALAAEPTKQEPVAWQYKDEPSFDGNCWHDNYQVTTSKQVAQFKDKNAQPLYATPPAAAPEPTHPGYIIGSHWLETAYSRICAGEAEADVLRDCGWERVADVEALRRDAERLNWVRVELFRPIWDGATDKPCEWHLRDDYKHTIQRMQGNNFRDAIDAAMQEDKT
jgi:hypothetical protein